MRKRPSDNYLKFVEWSDKDQCYIGTAPGLILGRVHGKDQTKVFKNLCETVEEAIRLRVPIPSIAAALFARFLSRQDDSPTMKAVAALRNQFGGHAVKRVSESG